MVAVDVEEAHAAAAELGQQLLGLHVSAVGAPGDAAVGGDAMPDAVGLEAVDNLRIGPVEEIDAERLLARGKCMRQCDEEAALEGADLGDRAADAELGLDAHEPA